jgi:hypothetical protein
MTRPKDDARRQGAIEVPAGRPLLIIENIYAARRAGADRARTEPPHPARSACRRRLSRRVRISRLTTCRSSTYCGSRDIQCSDAGADLFRPCLLA